MNLEHKPVIQRLRRGVGAQGFSQAANLFIRLAEVPLFLAFWGAERYGEWLMVAAIPSYLAMADGGFAGATQREMTMRMGAGDRQGAHAVFQSTWVLLLILSAALLGIALLAATLLPLDHWLKLNSIQGSTLTTVILLLTAHVALGFQCGIVYGGYTCEGRYARGTNLTTLAGLLDFAGLALAVMLGGGPVSAAAGFLAGRVLGFITFLIDLSRVAPWLNFGWHYASKAQIRRLWRPSFASMAFPLGNALNIQGMRLVVGLVLGPLAVAVFSTIRTLCSSAMKPNTIIARLIEPEMALAYGAGNQELVRKLFLRGSQIALWVALPTCMVLWFAGDYLLQMWTRSEVSMEPLLYLFLLLASSVNSVWFTALMVPYATNRHGRIAIFYACTQVSTLFLALLLGINFGIVGFGIALLITELILMATILRHALVLADVSSASWLQTVMYPSAMYQLVINKLFR